MFIYWPCIHPLTMSSNCRISTKEKNSVSFVPQCSEVFDVLPMVITILRPILYIVVGSPYINQQPRFLASLRRCRCSHVIARCSHAPPCRLPAAGMPFTITSTVVVEWHYFERHSRLLLLLLCLHWTGPTRTGPRPTGTDRQMIRSNNWVRSF